MYGKKIKELRKEQNITQKALAKVLDCNQSMISQWENGICEPTENYIRKTAIFFDVTSDYLLGLEELDGRKIESKTYNITFK
ncbi:MAG: helix-turn-helix transcriptional regulator [Clostridiales bacterium]|nr:helix-turn-helix transcriptional regulator [Clostridiales bacterium]